MMVQQRDPFVSGLAGSIAHLPNARGLQILDLIVALASDKTDELAPLAFARFDGVERIPADDAAKAEIMTHGHTMRLVELIKADPQLLTQIAAGLARSEPR
jgi:hypothetical protein